MKNFVVKCPQDWDKNQKWKEVIEALNKLTNQKFNGGHIGWFYGVFKGNGYSNNQIPENTPELSIDQAHAVLCGIDWSCEGVEVVYKDGTDAMYVVKTSGKHSENNFSGVVTFTKRDSHWHVGENAYNWGKKYFIAHIPDSETKVEEIKVEEKEINYTIYQQLRLLGFKKEVLSDKVFSEKHGFEPFVMKRKIGKKLHFIWDATIPESDEIKLCLDGVVLHTDTIEKVKETLKNLEK